MNPLDIFKWILAGEVVMILTAVAVTLAIFTLFLCALISCINGPHDQDRLMWVLVILFVPLIGPILYFTTHKSASRGETPPVASAHGPTALPAAATDQREPMDILAMQDEKRRAAAINEALSAMSRSARR